MGWCKHCKDSGGFFSTSYTCVLNNEYIPTSMVNEYCKYDYKASRCPWYKQYGTTSSSWCFITTMACNILGKDDKDPVLQSLRTLRNDFLQKNDNYDFVLKGYDTIGPIAADKLAQDEKREEVASELYESALTPIAKLVEKEKYDIASELYYCMTLRIYKKYGLLEEYNKLMDRDFGYEDGEFNPEDAGHGLKLTRNK